MKLLIVKLDLVYLSPEKVTNVGFFFFSGFLFAYSYKPTGFHGPGVSTGSDFFVVVAQVVNPLAELAT